MEKIGENGRLLSYNDLLKFKEHDYINILLYVLFVFFQPNKWSEANVLPQFVIKFLQFVLLLPWIIIRKIFNSLVFNKQKYRRPSNHAF